MKNAIYWTYNVPLQAYPIHENEDDESTPVVDYSIVNYMARKNACNTFNLSELLNDSGQSQEEYFEAAAAHLENLALLFRKLAKKEVEHIYYADEGMNKDNLA